MEDKITVSGTSSPYTQNYYTAGSTDKNTLDITDYFQLLAAQLQNQDMTNPMDNSEMMAQLTQMAMVQSMTAMTESIQTTSTINTQIYAASLVGQEVTVAVTEENAWGVEQAVGVKYGKVESVNFTGATPTVKLEGDDKDYPLSYLLGMGRIPDPYAEPEDPDGEDGGGDVSESEDGNQESKKTYAIPGSIA